MDIFSKDQPFQFGEAIYQDGGAYGPIHHEHMDISFIRKGDVICNIDGKEMRFGTGDAIFAYSENNYEMILAKGQRHDICWCHTGELSIPKKYKSQLRTTVPQSMPATPLMLTLFKEGITLGHGKTINLARLRNSLGETLFNEYFYQAKMEEEDRTYPRAVARAKRYIEKNFTQPCTLSSIAEQIGLNPRYLLRLFKEHMGITPTRYLWQLRAEKGVYLLHQSKLSVNRIADQCGFQSPHHFSRLIKEYYGESPSKLRMNTEKRDPFKFNEDVPEIRY